MKWSDFEHYLKAEHLNGRKPIVTIAEIVIETTHANGGQAEDKPVMYFVGAKKGLILSPTNQRTLRASFDDDVQSCQGKRIQLESISMRVAGRDTFPIRINPAPATPTPAPQPQPQPQPATAIGD